VFSRIFFICNSQKRSRGFETGVERCGVSVRARFVRGVACGAKEKPAQLSVISSSPAFLACDA